MTFNKSAIALAIAGVAGGSAAYALPPGSPVDVQLVQMGSSAVGGAIEQVWGDYCASGSLTEYRDATSLNATGYATGGSNYRAYFCTLGSKTSIPTSLQGKNMLYFERLTGGSVYGVNPVATSTPETYMNLSTCSAVTSTQYACTASGNGLTSAAPDLGISDVEPSLFVAVNLPTAFSTQLTPTQLSSLTINPLLQQTFGVAIGSGQSGAVTNLSAAQITSILVGNYTSFSEVGGSSAAITLCLRQPGSGTQAAANAIFLANPCSATGQQVATGGATFNSSTGAVKTCVDGNPNSIGILSLADGPTPGTDTFKFASIGGIAPTAANAATGAYVYAVESTLQFRKSGPYTTNQTALLNALNFILSDPADLAIVNSGLPQAALNAETANGYTPNNPYVASNPVEYGSKQGNTCAPNELFFP